MLIRRRSLPHVFSQALQRFNFHKGRYRRRHTCEQAGTTLIRIQRLEERTLLSAVPIIIDNGDAGFSTIDGTAEWRNSPINEGRDGDIIYVRAGNGSNTARWEFTGLEPGNYRVSATWSIHSNRATNAPYTIFDSVGGTVLNSALVNQELAPDDATFDGSTWEHLSVVTITGNTLVVELNNAANEFVIADAVMIEMTEAAPSPPMRIIDDGDAGFTLSEGWNKSPIGEGRQNDVRTAYRGDGSKVATWTFSGLSPGEYRVSATWSIHANRATNAPYSIFDGVGGSLLGRVEVNQELSPDDFTADGSSWEDLMTVTITGDTLVVQLSNDANEYVIADAVRIELVAPPQITIDGDFSDWEAAPAYTDPADDQHDTDHKGADDTPAYVNHPDVDLLTYKVSHDAENFYFYFEARGQIGRTQMEDLANGLRAGRYYVIVTIDVDDDDSTGYPLHEGGYYPTTTGYDMNAEIEFYNGAFNTGHYLNHGALDETELHQAFADQSQGGYDPNGPDTQGPFPPGFVNIKPGTYEHYTQWVYKENDPDLGGNDSVTFVKDKGPVVEGIVDYAISPDGHQLEMRVPFKGFLTDAEGNPIVGIGKTVDLSFSLEASGEFSGEVSEQNPDGLWASDTADPINGYFIRPVV